jgi:hypothetical protein
MDGFYSMKDKIPNLVLNNESEKGFHLSDANHLMNELHLAGFKNVKHSYIPVLPHENTIEETYHYLISSPSS